MVSTHLKNISQIGSFPQVGVKIKNIWNHHPENVYTWNLFVRCSGGLNPPKEGLENNQKQGAPFGFQVLMKKTQKKGAPNENLQ